MKKLIFSGCSYTYGAGIEREYPTAVSTDFIPQEYKIKNCTFEQLEFIHENRFSRLVAEKLGTTDLNNSVNGGDIDYGLGEIEKHFNKGASTENVGAIVFQITNLDRGRSYVFSTKHNKMVEFGLQSHQMGIEEEVNKLIDLVEEYGTFEKVVELAHIDKLKRLEESLKPYEEMGIPVFIIHWRDGHPQLKYDIYNSYGDLVSDNDWLAERRIHLKYKSVESFRFSDLYIKYPELIVDGDLNSGKYDDHATILGHKILADNIYEHIKDKINL
jgi:hypothetical protein